MNGIISLWFWPIAVFKWTMFKVVYKRKSWDGSSYSYEVQLMCRVWSPIYWLRMIGIFMILGCSYTLTKHLFVSEFTGVGIPVKSRAGYIPLRIWKPIRYMYYFTTVYML